MFALARALAIASVARVYWPTIVADVQFKAVVFRALNVAVMAGSAYRLEIVIIEKQIQVTFVSNNVVNDGGRCICAASLEHNAARLMLAAIPVTQQDTAAQDLPRFSLIEPSVFRGFRCPPFVHAVPRPL